MKFFSPRQAAKVIGIGPATMHRHCVRHVGFAQWLDGHWRIPEAHIDRFLEGETPAQIGRSPTLRGSNAIGSGIVGGEGDTVLARRQLVRAYFCLLAARHYADEISDPSRDRLLGALAGNVLDAMKTLRLIEPGGLRAAISECDGPGEFSALTGFSASY